jgi:PII-like signaling protein
MHLPEEAELLRVFVGEGDKYRHRPLYERVFKVRFASPGGVT